MIQENRRNCWQQGYKRHVIILGGQHLTENMADITPTQ